MTSVQVNTKRPSLRARLVNAIMGPVYRIFRRPEVVDGAPADGSESAEAVWQPPAGLQASMGLLPWQDRGDVWTLDGARPGAPWVLYLHGGSYWHTPIAAHFAFLRGLVKATGAQVIFPIYPRAPQYDYRQTHRMVLDLWKQLQSYVDPDRVLFMGDSAGGGLALALAQELRDQHEPQPGGLVLLAPWLDVSMQNPEIARQEAVDPMLRRDRILPMATFYAHGDWTSPLVSPLFGGLRDLPTVWFFQGTRDILYPDAVRFSEKALQEGCDLELYVAPGMLHVYPLYPTREGRAARKQIYRIVARFGAKYQKRQEETL